MPAPSRPCNVLDGGAAHDPCADSARSAVVDQHLSPGAVMNGPLAAFMLAQPHNDWFHVKTEGGRHAGLAAEFESVGVLYPNLIAGWGRHEDRHAGANRRLGNSEARRSRDYVHRTLLQFKAAHLELHEARKVEPGHHE